MQKCLAIGQVKRVKRGQLGRTGSESPITTASALITIAVVIESHFRT